MGSAQLPYKPWLVKALLRAILRDEVIGWHKKNSDPNVPTIIDANGRPQVGARN